MTELSFLLDLLLNEKPSKGIKYKLLSRIKDIQQPTIAGLPLVRGQAVVTGVSAQAPSTQAILARNQDLAQQPNAMAQQVIQPSGVTLPVATPKNINDVQEVDTGRGTRGPKKWR